MKLFLAGCALLLVCVVLETWAGPARSRGAPKPPNCPHGKCFIDCKKICSCDSSEGEVSCTQNSYYSSWECAQIGTDENCPMGETYKSPLWSDNFLCYCNHDSSKTYECFDLTTKTPAERQLLVRPGTKFEIVKRTRANITLADGNNRLY